MRRRSDLDRAFASDRPTSADADRRRERLDDRHLGADPPAVLGDRGITSGTPWPRASRANRWINGP